MRRLSRRVRSGDSSPGNEGRKNRPSQIAVEVESHLNDKKVARFAEIMSAVCSTRLRILSVMEIFHHLRRFLDE